MPFIRIDEAKGGSAKIRSGFITETDWNYAKGELDNFNIPKYSNEENFFLIEEEDLRVLLERLEDIKKDTGKKAYVAALIGIGGSQNPNADPKEKLTVVLFPVVYEDNSAIKPDWKRYKFYKKGGVLDRNNKKYIRQTWIDPSSANTSGDKQAIVKHFDEHS